METESERSQRLEASRRYSAEKRARESEEKRAERRMMDRKRAAERRARESEWERECRLALGRQRAAERRAAETDDEREHRLAQNRERLASKRASKAEKPPTLALEPAAMTTSGQLQRPPAAAEPCLGVGVAEGGGLDDCGQEQNLILVNGVKEDPERAGLTTATTMTMSDPLLPASVSVSTRDEREVVDVMASVSVVQPQQEQQQQIGATAEQATATPSTSSGAAASGGGEKSSTQEVLEIKEFRAGKFVVLKF